MQPLLACGAIGGVRDRPSLGAAAVRRATAAKVLYPGHVRVEGPCSPGAALRQVAAVRVRVYLLEDLPLRAGLIQEVGRARPLPPQLQAVADQRAHLAVIVAPGASAPLPVEAHPVAVPVERPAEDRRVAAASVARVAPVAVADRAYVPVALLIGEVQEEAVAVGRVVAPAPLAEDAVTTGRPSSAVGSDPTVVDAAKADEAAGVGQGPAMVDHQTGGAPVQVAVGTWVGGSQEAHRPHGPLAIG